MEEYTLYLRALTDGDSIGFPPFSVKTARVPVQNEIIDTNLMIDYDLIKRLMEETKISEKDKVHFYKVFANSRYNVTDVEHKLVSRNNSIETQLEVHALKM